ncbi:hypothetical protein KCP71_24140 [Salmonella enterica subsp. enterica]|nr:hypothetical protein KCP71_24140 [Salmonella enterica subsp. enterica]
MPLRARALLLIKHRVPGKAKPRLYDRRRDALQSVPSCTKSKRKAAICQEIMPQTVIGGQSVCKIPEGLSLPSFRQQGAGRRYFIDG